MKLLVCGGRDFRDRDLVWMNLDAAVRYADCHEIICGYNPKDARFQGADQLAFEWAQENEFPCRTFPADWHAFGRGAGPRRNSQMAADKPDECIAFPRANGQWGAGTLDMIGKAAKVGAVIHRVSARDMPADAAKPSPLAPAELGPGRNNQPPDPSAEGK